MEEAGRVRRGYFVEGLGAAQFALPGADDRLRRHRDVDELAVEAHFRPGGFVDLGQISKRNGMKNHGLRGLAGVLLGFRISKRAQRSNWANRNLSPEQVHYAATDAWVGREIYLAMQQRGLH